MIVRLMGEGQYRIDDGLHADLDRLDEEAVAFIDADDEASLDAKLEEMWRLVQSRGERLPDDSLEPSELLIPPSDLTLEETRALFSEQGLIPDLPAD